MAIRYYNLPDYPRFLPIVEAIKDGKPTSFVYALDYDMVVNDTNWNHFATSYAIKKYIDEKASKIENDPYLYEDYFLATYSILRAESGTDISDNITSIFYPTNATTAKFNTTKEIMFSEDNVNINIPASSTKTITGFYNKEFMPQEEVFVNSDFKMPFTWCNTTTTSISEDGIYVEPESSIYYNFYMDYNVPVVATVEALGDYRVKTLNSNQIVIENTSEDKRLHISKVVVKDGNILANKNIRTTRNSYCDTNDSNSLNCYWDMYMLGNTRSSNTNIEARFTPPLKTKVEGYDTLYVYEMNPLSFIRTLDIVDFGDESNTFRIDFCFMMTDQNAKVFQKGGVFPTSNTTQQMHLMSLGGKVELKLQQSSRNPNTHYDIAVRNIDKDIEVLYPVSLQYGVRHMYTLSYSQNRISLSVDDGTPMVMLDDRFEFQNTIIEVGAKGNMPAYYGDFVMGRMSGSSVVPVFNATIGSIYEPVSVWAWNTNITEFDTKQIDVKFENNRLVSGVIETPVFDPADDTWSLESEFEVNPELLQNNTELFASKDKFSGLNMTYLNDMIQLTIHTKSTKNANDLVATESKSKTFNVQIPDNGLIKLKVEFTGYKYMVYGGEFGIDLLGEYVTSETIAPTYFRIIGREGCKINKNKFFIDVADSVWWSFEHMNITRDFAYSNYDMSNKIRFDSEGYSIPADVNMIYIPLSLSDYKVVIPFKTISEDNPNNTILSYYKDGVGVKVYYEKSDSSIRMSNGSSTVYIGYNITFPEKYILEITHTSGKIEAVLYDNDYGRLGIGTTTITGSNYLSRMILGATSALNTKSMFGFKMEGVYVWGNDIYSSWNGIAPDSMTLYRGSVVYIPQQASSGTAYPFTVQTLTSDLSVSDIAGNVFYRTGALTAQYKEPIRIIKNGQRTSNIVFIEIDQNRYYYNGATFYGCVVGGVENYQDNTVNKYIYPRHINNIYKNYGGIDYSPTHIYNGCEYEFAHDDKVYTGTFNYKLGKTVSANITESSIFDDGEILQLNLNPEDYIRVYSSNQFVGSIQPKNMSLVKHSDIVDGNFTSNTWMKESVGGVEKLSYYSDKDYLSVVALVGSEINGTDTLNITSSNDYYYPINKNNWRNAKIASTFTRNSTALIDFTNNNSSKLNSVQILDNFVKSGDFISMEDWYLSTPNYRFDKNGELIIMKDEEGFTLSQHIYELGFDGVEVFSKPIMKKGEKFILTFTVNSFDEGRCFVRLGGTEIAINEAKTYSEIIEMNTDLPELIFTSDGIATQITLSNISLISMNRVVDNEFNNPDEWEITGSGIKMGEGMFISLSSSVRQSLVLEYNRKYNGSIRFSQVNGQFELWHNEDRLMNINTDGVYPFSFVAGEENVITIKQVSGVSAKVMFIEINEDRYIVDPYFELFSGWNTSQQGANIIDGKLVISNDNPVSVISAPLQPSREYTFTWTSELERGSYQVSVGGELETISIDKIFNTIGKTYEEIKFTTPDVRNCNLTIVSAENTTVKISDFKATLDNYIIGLDLITSNWQIMNNEFNVRIIDHQMEFINANSSTSVIQYSPLLEVGKEYTIKMNYLGNNIPLVCNFGGNDGIQDVNGSFTGIMGAGQYIIIHPKSNGFTGTISSVSLLIKTEDFPLSENSSLLGTKSNNSVIDVKLPYVQTDYSFYNGKKIGVKVGNTFTSGYFNVDDRMIENLQRNKTFMTTNLGTTDVKINAANKLEVMRTNYIFIDASGKTFVSSEVPYGKLKSDVPTSSGIWYNLIDKKFYNYATGDVVYLLGNGYTSSSGLVFTDNIQKERKFMYYTDPKLSSNTLEYNDYGLFDIPSMYFPGSSLNVGLSGLTNGSYIVYRKNTSMDNQYNLDVGDIYVDTTHVNESATWSSWLGRFISPYTLDSAICEVYIENGNMTFYNLDGTPDIVEKGAKYHRITYKNPTNGIKYTEGFNEGVMSVANLMNYTFTDKAVIEWFE